MRCEAMLVAPAASERRTSGARLPPSSPALWPKSVTREGSPPKAAMLACGARGDGCACLLQTRRPPGPTPRRVPTCTQCSAASWSMRP